MADLVGTYIAPLPFIEHLAASRLLASVAPDHENLPLLASGEKIATMGLQPQAGSASTLIPAGAIADTAIVFDGDNLLLETAGKISTSCSEYG